MVMTDVQVTPKEIVANLTAPGISVKAVIAWVWQCMRIVVGGLGIWQLMTPHGDRAFGFTLLTASGLSAGGDVAKVDTQMKKLEAS
jgi:hypothetical protein